MATDDPPPPSPRIADTGVHIDIPQHLDFACLLAGAIPWYKGVADGLPIVGVGRAGPVAVRVAGLALLGACVQLRMSAIDACVQQRTPVAHNQAVTALLVDGPFAHSRNPMYVSLVGSLMSMGLIMNSWWGIASSAPLAAYLQLRVIPAEEEYLRGKFPEFAEYERRTPRWFRGPWNLAV
mmetsp:Transcript_8427/g.24111  ORF Transcript_8427/g.24111 Transcript_8427/m.24111 type:complete len:180 (+) Transcript_8427:88-627(+)